MKLLITKLDLQDNNHKNLIKQMRNDEEIINNVSIILYDYQNSYVIELDTNPVGLVKINEEQDKIVSIDIGILKEFRNMKIGKNSLNIIIQEIKNQYKKLILRTSNNNAELISIAEYCGFRVDYDEIEKAELEGNEYNIFSIISPYFKEEDLKKQNQKQYVL